MAREPRRASYPRGRTPEGRVGGRGAPWCDPGAPGAGTTPGGAPCLGLALAAGGALRAALGAALALLLA